MASPTELPISELKLDEDPIFRRLFDFVVDTKGEVDVRFFYHEAYEHGQPLAMWQVVGWKGRDRNGIEHHGIVHFCEYECTVSEEDE